VNQHQQADLDSSSDSDDSDGDEYFSGSNHATQRGTKRVKDTSHHTTGVGASADQPLASGSSSEHSSSSSTVTSVNHDSDDVDELGLPNIDSLSIDGGGTGDSGGGT
jgi:hypothetical protein